MRFLAPVLALLMSGCFFGGCGFMPDAAVWNDPDLFEAMDAPVELPEGVATGDENYTIRAIDFIVEVDGERTGLIYAQGMMFVNARGPGQDDGIRTAATWFLQNATRFDDETIDAYANAFMESREVHGSGTTYEDGHQEEHETRGYRLELAIQGQDFLANLGLEPTGPQVRIDEISVGIESASKSLDVGGLVIRSDLFGQSSASYDWAEGTPEDEVEQNVRAVLESQGLPAPENMDVHGTIC